MSFTLVAVSSAHADVFKCKNPQGLIEYSDVPCAGAIKVNVQSSPTTAPSGNPNERALGIYLREALAEKDFARANKLAVTPEHFELIRAAQASQKISLGTNSPPTVCKFSSYLYGDEKGQVLADNAKAECIKNNELKAAGRGNEISLEHYNYWKDHSGSTSAKRTAAVPVNCTPNGIGGYRCQ